MSADQDRSEASDRLVGLLFDGLRHGSGWALRHRTWLPTEVGGRRAVKSPFLAPSPTGEFQRTRRRGHVGVATVADADGRPWPAVRWPGLGNYRIFREP